MWRLGFFFHEMGFGLLSIFLPLYIVSPSVGGSLVDVGTLVCVALFLAIPASFFWGYVSDKTRRYKRYILLSFLASAVLLYLFTMTTNIGLLIVIYAIMGVLHVAHEAPKNVLIAESFSRADWEKSFAEYEGFTEVGWLLGLLLGFFMSMFQVGSVDTLLVCSGLNLIAFAISFFLVADPLLIFERGLVSIEKTVDFTSQGVFLASRILDGASVHTSLRRENIYAFCGGLILFSLASSILFTPLPVFVSNIVRSSSLPASVVFLVFILNSGGSAVGYALVSKRTSQSSERKGIGRLTILRSVLAFLLIPTLGLRSYDLIFVTLILVAFALAYSFFTAHTLSLSMELVPAGKSGLFNVLAGVGAALGSFLGPFVAQAFGFSSVFGITGLFFFSAYLAFRVF